MLTNNSPENILHTAYEAKMISSGDNSPSIKIKGTKLQYLLVMLHLGFKSNIVKMVLGWTNEEFEERINSLEVEGLLKQTGGRYYPTCMVITACEGKKLYNLCEPLIKQTLKIIEENYLKKKRPLRNKKRYYYAIQEQELADIEAFGMYGNTYLDLGEVQIGLYGNSRYSTLNLITANNEIFEEYFQNTLSRCLNQQIYLYLTKLQTQSVKIYSYYLMKTINL
jgi:hypothetical protein